MAMRSAEVRKYQRKSTQAYAVCGNTAVRPVKEEDRSTFSVVRASGCPDRTAEEMLALTRAGETLSALMGLIETVLIFLVFRLSLSYVPVFAVGVLWISLTILSGVFLDRILPVLYMIRVLIRCMCGGTEDSVNSLVSDRRFR